MDPETIEITMHAFERFVERRKGKGRHKNAEKRIRKLLTRSKELFNFSQRDEDASRYFLREPWCFVIRENQVVTVFNRSQEHIFELKPKKRREKSSNQKWRWH